MGFFFGFSLSHVSCCPLLSMLEDTALCFKNRLSLSVIFFFFSISLAVCTTAYKISLHSWIKEIQSLSNQDCGRLLGLILQRKAHNPVFVRHDASVTTLLLCLERWADYNQPPFSNELPSYFSLGSSVAHYPLALSLICTLFTEELWDCCYIKCFLPRGQN